MCTTTVSGTCQLQQGVVNPIHAVSHEHHPRAALACSPGDHIDGCSLDLGQVEVASLGRCALEVRGQGAAPRKVARKDYGLHPLALPRARGEQRHPSGAVNRLGGLGMQGETPGAGRSGTSLAASTRSARSNL